MTPTQESCIRLKTKEAFPFAQGDTFAIDGRGLQVVKVRNTGTQKYVNFWYIDTPSIMEKMGYLSFLHAVGIE